VILAGVGDADQPALGRRQQQRADRAVDGGVGEVEDAAGLGSAGQAAAQLVEVLRAVGEGAGQGVVGAHGCSPFPARTPG